MGIEWALCPGEHEVVDLMETIQKSWIAIYSSRGINFIIMQSISGPHLPAFRLWMA